jgi:hypothetical protein
MAWIVVASGLRADSTFAATPLGPMYRITCPSRAPGRTLVPVWPPGHRSPVYRITGHYPVALSAGCGLTMMLLSRAMLLYPYPDVADTAVGDDDQRLLRYGAV